MAIEFDKILELPTPELENELVGGNWGSGINPSVHYRQIELELKRRQKEEEQSRFNKTLKLSEDNVKQSRNLVKATWGLVIVTAILVFVTFLGQ